MAQSTSSGRQLKSRHFKRIPIFIVENHNDVLEFILRCLGSNHLPFSNNKIIHFDSHPDMTIPKYVPAEFVRTKEKLLDALSIENWLMPIAYAGHLNDLIWIKPNWSNQIDDGSYHIWIGDHCGFIRCDSTLEYFVSEGTYRPECDLNNKKMFDLTVSTLSSIEKDTDTTKYEHICDSVNESNATYILDIDLDFFSTHNPFYVCMNNDKLSTEIYEKLKVIFKGDFFVQKFSQNDNADDLLAFVERRLRHLDDLELVFSELDEGNSIGNIDVPDSLHNIWDQLKALVETISAKDNRPDWMLYYNAGCTFDSNELPHHESTPEEIDVLVDNFRMFLQQLKRPPTIVTISRSSEDDYCPSNQVECIQAKVLGTLKDVFGEKMTNKPIHFYKEEEWNVFNIWRRIDFVNSLLNE